MMYRRRRATNRRRWRMATKLILQNPGSDALLRALLTASEGAVRGGGVFSWTNSAGIQAFLEDDALSAFLKAGQFELVVGVDSITDEPAVRSLIALTKKRKGLRTRAFLHNTGALFHPKLAWFASKQAVTLIVGSGNLTRGGLMSNWEAFTVSRITGDEAAATELQFKKWLIHVDEYLVDITDGRVLTRAKKNKGNERAIKRAGAVAAADRAINVVGNAPILIAEVPRSGGRPSQVNLDKANFQGFFGASIGSQRTILLYEALPNGELGEVEARPGVARQSKNYSFELRGARQAPKTGHAIAVFLRFGPSDFAYVCLRSGEAGFAEVDTFLAARWAGPSRQVRRIPTTVEELRTAWPQSPLWKASLPPL